MPSKAIKTKATKKLIEYGAIGLASYLFIIRPISNIFGESKEEKELKEAEKALPFNKFWWQKVKQPNILQGQDPANLASKFKLLAKKINDAWGFFNDDEAQVISTFKSLQTQIQVSLLSFMYQKKYGIDLFTDLRDRMSDSEVLTIVNYVERLPKYFPR